MEALAETFLIAGGIGLSLAIAGLILVQTFRTMAPTDDSRVGISHDSTPNRHH